MLIGCHDSGPRKFYDVEYGAFVVEVTNSVLGVPNSISMNFYKIEEDGYGRMIYIFSGFSITAEDNERVGRQLWAVLIQQKTDDDYVYYYPDFNFIVKEFADSKQSVSKDVFLENTYHQLPKEEIEALKENNDWNKPFNADKMIKKPILDFGKTIKAARVSEDGLKKVYEGEFKDNYPNPDNFFVYMTSDDFGRDIFFCRTVDDRLKYKDSYLIMFFPDDSYLIYEITDLWNYQEELKEFKVTNLWNQPFME